MLQGATIASSSVGGNASACMRSPSQPCPVRSGLPTPSTSLVRGDSSVPSAFQRFYLAVPALTCVQREEHLGMLAAMMTHRDSPVAYLQRP